MRIARATAVVLSTALLLFGQAARSHCDTLDGPVVSAARKALDSGDVRLVLVWVQQKDDAEIRAAFQRARTVRRAGAEARELADLYFFETLVRVHRTGEGAAYTGLKPAGSIEPPVAAADAAIASGRLAPLAALIAERTEKGLHAQFEEVMTKKKYDAANVDAGRAYSNAYVEFVHYAERLFESATTLAPEHAKTSATHAH